MSNELSQLRDKIEKFEDLYDVLSCYTVYRKLLCRLSSFAAYEWEVPLEANHFSHRCQLRLLKLECPEKTEKRK